MLKGKALLRTRSAGYVLLGMAVGSILRFLFMPSLQFCVSMSDFRFIGQPMLLLPLFYALGGAYLISVEVKARSKARRMIGLVMFIIGMFVLIMRMTIFLFLRDATDVQFGSAHVRPDLLIQFLTYFSFGAIVGGCLLFWSSRRVQLD
jgi:hypothetical protein